MSSVSRPTNIDHSQDASTLLAMPQDYARTECTEETASPDLSEDGMSEELCL